MHDFVLAYCVVLPYGAVISLCNYLMWLQQLMLCFASIALTY